MKVGYRVKLSKLGVERLVFRSAHTRKLTEFTVGTVVSMNTLPHCVIVRWDNIKTVSRIARAFLRRSLPVV